MRYTTFAGAARGGEKWPEQLAGGELDNKQFNDFPQTKVLSEFYDPPETVLTPRVLKDGSDSVGVLGALNRVSSISVCSARNGCCTSSRWSGASRSPRSRSRMPTRTPPIGRRPNQTPDLALFFLKTAQADHLKDAPGGAA